LPCAFLQDDFFSLSSLLFFFPISRLLLPESKTPLSAALFPPLLSFSCPENLYLTGFSFVNVRVPPPISFPSFFLIQQGSSPERSRDFLLLSWRSIAFPSSLDLFPAPPVPLCMGPLFHACPLHFFQDSAFSGFLFRNDTNRRSLR